MDRLGIKPEDVTNITLGLFGKAERVSEEHGTPAFSATSPQEDHS